MEELGDKYSQSIPCNSQVYSGNGEFFAISLRTMILSYNGILTPGHRKGVQNHNKNDFTHGS